MIVVADTTPLNHLILIDEVNLLKALYGRVIIPQTVLSELQDEAAPPRVKEWISNRPEWLEVKHAASILDPSLAYLDPGERDAIFLAQDLKADVLLMDDPAGAKKPRTGILIRRVRSPFSISAPAAGLSQTSRQP